MDRYEYGVIEIVNTYSGKEYKFYKSTSYSLLSLLNDIGYYGWELVGEVQRELLVKKKIKD